MEAIPYDKNNNLCGGCPLRLFGLARQFLRSAAITGREMKWNELA